MDHSNSLMIVTVNVSIKAGVKKQLQAPKLLYAIDFGSHDQLIAYFCRVLAFLVGTHADLAEKF